MQKITAINVLIPYSLNCLVRLLLCCGLLLIQGCASKTPPMTDDEVTAHFHANGTTASLQEISTLAMQADFILIGETHTNTGHHQVQADILAAMAANGHKVVLGLEMVDVTMQSVLDKFHRAEISLGDLQEQLDWKNKWGYDFSLYYPIFVVAQRYSIPVHALNVPANMVRAVSESGFENTKKSMPEILPTKILSATPQHEARLKNFYDQHALALKKMGKTQRGTWESFLLVQNLWDSAMAENATTAKKNWKRPVVILAGLGHVEYGFGIANRLKELSPKSTTLSIVPVTREELADLHKKKYTTNNDRLSQEQITRLLNSTINSMKSPTPSTSQEPVLPAPGDFLFYVGQPRKTSTTLINRASQKTLPAK